MGLADREYQKSMSSGRPSLPPVTKALIAVNAVIFIIDYLLRPDQGGMPGPSLGPLVDFGAFTVAEGLLGGRIWELITFQFLHESLGHVLFNMVGVYVFGPWVERWWGSRRFLAYYLLCGVAGALFFSLLMGVGLLPNSHPQYSQLVGASAGVFGLVFAVYRLAPATRVSLIFPPITLTMRQLALVFGGLAILTVLGGLIMPDARLFSNSGGEAGHLGGALMGLLLMKFPQVLGKKSEVQEKVIRPRQFRRRVGTKIKPRTEVDLRAESEVDRILEKVSREGIDSLTDTERETLAEAARRHS